MSGSEDAPRIDGLPGAPLLVVHADFSCPDCALAMRRLRPLALRLDLRHIVLRSRGTAAKRAAHAAEAAALQDAFWPFAAALLDEQGRQELPDLWALAGRLGLDVDRFEADRRSNPGSERIARETRDALARGATQVPALFATPQAAAVLEAATYAGSFVRLPQH